MIQTIYKNNNVIKQQVYFMSAFYRPGEGVKALVIKDDNRVHEIDPLCLSLPADKYNKIFFT